MDVFMNDSGPDRKTKADQQSIDAGLTQLFGSFETTVCCPTVPIQGDFDSEDSGS